MANLAHSSHTWRYWCVDDLHAFAEFTIFCTTSKSIWLGVLRPNVHFKQTSYSFLELFCSNDSSSNGWTTGSSRRLAFSRREGTTKASKRAAFSLTWHDDHEEHPRIWEWKCYRRTSIGHSFDIGSENGCFGVEFHTHLVLQRWDGWISTCLPRICWSRICTCVSHGVSYVGFSVGGLHCFIWLDFGVYIHVYRCANIHMYT